MEEKNNIASTEPETKKRRLKLRYNKWLVKNIPFYFFAAALAIFYIANGHYADKLVLKISTTEKHLKEMEYEYKTVKRDVIFRSKESELAKAVEPLGLQQLAAPPMLIRDTIK